MFYVGLDIHTKHISICVLNQDGKVHRRDQVRQVDQLGARSRRAPRSLRGLLRGEHWIWPVFRVAERAGLPGGGRSSGPAETDFSFEAQERSAGRREVGQTVVPRGSSRRSRSHGRRAGLARINHVSAKAGAEADACQEWRSGPLAPSRHYCSAPSRDLDRQGPGLAQAARVLSTPAGLEKRSPGPGNRSVFAATGAGRERIGRLLARQPLGLAAAEHSGSRLTDGRSRGRVHRRSSSLRSQQESSHYFGLVPSQDQSGETNRLGHITREGCTAVRHLLVEAVWQALRRSATVRAYYERIQRNDPDRKKIAVVATAHYLVRVMWALLKNGTLWKEPGAQVAA